MKEIIKRGPRIALCLFKLYTYKNQNETISSHAHEYSKKHVMKQMVSLCAI